MGWERVFTRFGITLILIGVALILVPLIIKLTPPTTLEKIPWFLIYVYQKDGFFFATSPILIIISLIHLVWALLQR